jgi:hypothetical protein
MVNIIIHFHLVLIILILFFSGIHLSIRINETGINRRVHLLLHLSELEVVEVVDQGEVAHGHVLGSPVVLEDHRHSVGLHEGDDDLNIKLRVRWAD